MHTCKLIMGISTGRKQKREGAVHCNIRCKYTLSEIDYITFATLNHVEKGSQLCLCNYLEIRAVGGMQRRGEERRE